MGDRNCAFDGCNALEFRTSGYCLRHKGNLPDQKTVIESSPSSKTNSDNQLKPIDSLTDEGTLRFLAISFVLSSILALYGIFADWGPGALVSCCVVSGLSLGLILRAGGMDGGDLLALIFAAGAAAGASSSHSSGSGYARNYSCIHGHQVSSVTMPSSCPFCGGAMR